MLESPQCCNIWTFLQPRTQTILISLCSVIVSWLALVKEYNIILFALVNPIILKRKKHPHMLRFCNPPQTTMSFRLLPSHQILKLMGRDSFLGSMCMSFYNRYYLFSMCISLVSICKAFSEYQQSTATYFLQHCMVLVIE